MVDPGTTVSVSSFLQVSATAHQNSTALANFGHTAQLWLGLPAGTPFSSRSGVFLTEAPSLPVPEPAGWALWLAGLAATAGMVRRRDRTGAGGVGAPMCAKLLAITVATLAPDHAVAQPTVRASVADGNGGPLDSAVQFGPGARRASAFASRQNGGVPYGHQLLASAVADLPSGSIGVSAEWQDFGGATVGRWLTSHASFDDILTFHGTGTVRFSLGVVGSFDSLGPSLFDASAQLFVYSEALSSQGGPRISKIEFDWQNLPPWPLASTVEQGTVSGVSRDPAAITATLQVSIPVRDGDWVQLGASLGVGVSPARNDQAQALFGHTAQLRLQLPTGMRFDSASGLLLSAPPPPVPEPGTWAMLAAGLLLLLPRAQKRRRLCGGGAAAALLPALLLVAAPPASAQLASAGVWNSSNFSNPNPAANLRSQEVTSGRAEASHSATTSPFSDRVAWVAGASADLRRGSVGVEIQADRSGNPAATQGDTVWARAELNETLTFTGSRAGVVDFAAGISGSFQSIDGSAFRADSFLFAGGLSGQLDFHWVNNLSSPTVSVFASPGTTGIRNDPAGLFGTLHLLRLVQPGETLALQLRMDLRVGPGAHDHAVANFGHTAQLGITLPDGLSFTSASGQFMAEAPPLPVPEPAGAWLLLAGLPLLRAAQRR
jgi:hypothetical protein